MCGILGISNTKDIEMPLFNFALESINHRGPDSSDIYNDSYIYLGHTRLSIIDLDDRSNQPMKSKCGKYILVYNGEIYNYIKLKNKYLIDYNFTSKSDTEVLLALLIKFGAEIIGELDGIFSFAFYSLDQKKILFSRDYFGIKPLYYAYVEGKYICFSSEIKAILNLTNIKEVNKKHVAEHILYGYVSGENTLFKGVKRLLPGNVLEFDINSNKILGLKKFNIKKYKTIDNGSMYELNKLLLSSVHSQTISDVPIGVMLSGGLDSSILSSVCSSFKNEINSFTISLSHKKFDEAVYAKKLANSCNLNYNELKYEYKDFDYLFKKLTYYHDEPLRHINSLPIYSITKKARNMGVKVLLAGEGADEIFGGYSVYLKIKTKIFLSRLFKILPKGIINFLTKKGYFSFLNKIENLRNINDYLIYSRASSSLSQLSSITDLKLDNSYRSHISSEAIKNFPDDFVNAMMNVDQNIHLQSLLDRQDKMSMATSVECRVPFLNNNMSQFLNKMNSSFKVSKGVTKKILRDLSKYYLPRILTERRKHPFGLPLLEQLNSSDLFGTFQKEFSKSLVFKNGLVNKNFENLINNFLNGDSKNADLIYNVFSLEIWLKTFFDEN